MSLAMEAAYSYFVGDMNSNNGINATERDRGERVEGRREGQRRERREGDERGREGRMGAGGREGGMDIFGVLGHIHVASYPG